MVFGDKLLYDTKNAGLTQEHGVVLVEEDGVVDSSIAHA